jgi:hypothetical protein
MENEEYLKSLQSLSKDLLKDIKDVREGSLSINKAREISNLSSSAIKSIAYSIITVEQQKLQNQKLLMRANELKFKKEELEYKKSLLK